MAKITEHTFMEDMVVQEAEAQETWEITVPGGVSVWKKNRRTGEYEQTRVHGTNGPKILRISKDDRLYNQEIIPEENEMRDPFTNGSLVLVKDGKRIGITDETLQDFLEIEGQDPFREALESIADNELSLRRLLVLAQTDGTVPQVEAIKDLLDENYRVGGTQPTVREMMEEGDAKGELLTG